MNILFKGRDGSIAIMTVAPGADKDEAIRKFKECHPGHYLEHFEGDIELPQDRTFRDAWTLSNGKVVVDKQKAAEISRIREEEKKNTLEYRLEALEKAGK